MAYTKKTLADLRQGLADRHDSGVLPTSSATLSFWDRLLNRGQAYLADRLRLEQSTALTTVSGVIALPDDFLVMNRIFQDGTELLLIDKDDETLQEWLGYWITGNQYDGFILNTTEDKEYDVYYSFKPAEMVLTTDECIIPDPEAVVAYAYGMLRKSETDPIEDADESLAEADSRLVEMQSAQNINDNFTGFKIN